MSREPTGKHASVLAMITARGGSKGLPRKNIRTLAGKPLIAHTIENASEAHLLDRTVISTDDEEIMAVAREYGGDVPFLRPEGLARDESSVYPVLTHALRWLREHQGYSPDYVMLLQPTSPLRTAEDIDRCVELALEHNADGIVSLTEVKAHPYHTKLLSEDGIIGSFLPMDNVSDRRQGLPRVYAPNGAVYMGRSDLVMEAETFYFPRTYAYVMPQERSLDVDTPLDLHMAELILREEAQHGPG